MILGYLNMITQQILSKFLSHTALPDQKINVEKLSKDCELFGTARMRSYVFQKAFSENYATLLEHWDKDSSNTNTHCVSF